MADKPRTRGDDAHDVLAAEEFGVPAPDPTLHREEPHDVLAAEEFALPTRDDRHPPDPTGLHEPHDVLAAEEHAMPAPATAPPPAAGPAGSELPRLALVALAGAVAAVILLRRR